MGSANLYLLLLSGIGMMLVGVASFAICSYRVRPEVKWYAFGALIWVAAVAPKILCSILVLPQLLPALKDTLPHSAYVALGSLYIGVQSSAFEMGVTLGAALIWRQLARDAATGIAIGVGAGAVEALMLGFSSAAGALAAIAGLPGTETVGEQVALVAKTTPVFFLAGPVERAIAILCHVSTRALILLGVNTKRSSLAIYGFVIFTLLDGIAGGAHLTGAVAARSIWWTELAVLPFGLVSVPIIRWCYRNWSVSVSSNAGGPNETNALGSDGVDA